MQALVPKNRKPKFDLILRIIDLNNIPLACGTCTVKWHLPSSTSAEHRGRTDKALIREHKATWDHTKEIPVRLTIDKNHNLEECSINFEVLQEYHEGGKGRVQLGNVKLNLAEYVDHGGLDVRAREGDAEQVDEEGGISRRYLMQDSKINSTLKIGINMKQTEGDTNFIAPPLKSAMVFGGIAGIVSAETGEGDDMPSLSSKTRELSELQDVYRRTLAATWACQSGELPPDKLIEDLFAGGDGGRMEPPQTLSRAHHMSMRPPSRDESAGSSTSDSESRRTVTPHHLSPEMARNGIHRRYGSRSQDEPGSGSSGSQQPGMSRVSGRRSIEQQMEHSHGHRDGHRRHDKNYRELTEFDVRDDLRSWQIRAR